MIGYADAPQAWWLTQNMARVVGVDLPDAVLEGVLSRKELALMMLTCKSCGQDGKCSHFLAGTSKANHLPDYCANGRLLEALA